MLAIDQDDMFQMIIEFPLLLLTSKASKRDYEISISSHQVTLYLTNISVHWVLHKDKIQRDFAQDISTPWFQLEDMLKIIGTPQGIKYVMFDLKDMPRMQENKAQRAFLKTYLFQKFPTGHQSRGKF